MCLTVAVADIDDPEVGFLIEVAGPCSRRLASNDHSESTYAYSTADAEGTNVRTVVVHELEEHVAKNDDTDSGRI